MEPICVNCCTSPAEGIVVAVNGDSSMSNRLREMGFAPGAWMRVIRPGSPCLMQVGESRVALRGEETQQILFSPMDDAGVCDEAHDLLHKVG